jgi:hypothetical protein
MEKTSERVGGDQENQLVSNLHHAERSHDELGSFIERSGDAAIKSGQLAIRTVTLINGGAVIAVLGFISALASKDSERIAQIVPVATRLLWFSGGVAMAAAAAGFAYLTNYAATGVASRLQRTWNHPFVEVTVASKRWRWFATVCQWVAVLTAILSLCFFVIGTVNVEDAISHLR